MFIFLQLGTNPSAIGSTLLNKGDTHVLGPGGTFELLQTKYRYSVHFVEQSDKQPITNTSLNRTGSFRITNFFKATQKSQSKTEQFNVQQTLTSSQLDSAGKRKSSDEDNNQGGTLKRLKRPLLYMRKDRDEPMDIADGAVEEEYDIIELEDLRKEFGDDFVKEVRSSLEIELEDGKLQGQTSEKTNVEYTKTATSLPSPNHAGREAETKSVKDLSNSDMTSFPVSSKDTWDIKDGLMVFTSKELQPSRKVRQC